MARYFNRTSGSVAVTLRGGGSVYVPAKSWMNIPLEEENSADLIRALQKGYLARFENISSKTPHENEAPQGVKVEDRADAEKHAPGTSSQEG